MIAVRVPASKHPLHGGEMSSVRVIAVSGCLQGAEGTVATGGVFSGTYRLERLVDQ